MEKNMPRHASLARPGFYKLLGATALAVFLAGCAQQRAPHYYDAPRESTETDAMQQAQGRGGARAPAQIQLGFGANQQDQARGAAAGESTSASTAIAARPLAEPKTFLGTLPCLTGGAACSATRITLTLAPSGEWRARTAFLDRPDAKNNRLEQGCWNVIGTQPLRIVLQTQGEASKANLTFVNDNVLRVNMIDGIEPTLEHRLTRQPDIDGITELANPAALHCR
jgi:hypothetical protein